MNFFYFFKNYYEDIGNVFKFSDVFIYDVQIYIYKYRYSGKYNFYNQIGDEGEVNFF